MIRKSKASPSKAPVIQIGVSAQAVIETKKAIVEILKLPYVDNQTKRMAVKELRSMTSVTGTTISGFSITSR